MEGEGTPRIFSLLRKALHELSTEKEPLPLFLGFVIKYVSFMGYRPLIPIADGEEAYFLPDRGIVEGEYIPGGVAVDPADIYTFRHLLYTSLDKINLDMMEERTLENCYGLLIRYLKVNLDLDKIQSLQLRM